jgi:hypothetical protein
MFVFAKSNIADERIQNHNMLLLKRISIFFEKSSFPPLGASCRQVIAENNEFLKNHISCLTLSVLSQLRGAVHGSADIFISKGLL